MKPKEFEMWKAVWLDVRAVIRNRFPGSEWAKMVSTGILVDVVEDLSKLVTIELWYLDVEWKVIEQKGWNEVLSALHRKGVGFVKVSVDQGGTFVSRRSTFPAANDDPSAFDKWRALFVEALEFTKEKHPELHQLVRFGSFVAVKQDGPWSEVELWYNEKAWRLIGSGWGTFLVCLGHRGFNRVKVCVDGGGRVLSDRKLDVTTGCFFPDEPVKECEKPNRLFDRMKVIWSEIADCNGFDEVDRKLLAAGVVMDLIERNGEVVEPLIRLPVAAWNDLVTVRSGTLWNARKIGMERYNLKDISFAVDRSVKEEAPAPKVDPLDRLRIAWARLSEHALFWECVRQAIQRSHVAWCDETTVVVKVRDEGDLNMLTAQKNAIEKRLGGSVVFWLANETGTASGGGSVEKTAAEANEATQSIPPASEMPKDLAVTADAAMQAWFKILSALPEAAECGPLFHAMWWVQPLWLINGELCVRPRDARDWGILMNARSKLIETGGFRIQLLSMTQEELDYADAPLRNVEARKEISSKDRWGEPTTTDQPIQPPKGFEGTVRLQNAAPGYHQETTTAGPTTPVSELDQAKKAWIGLLEYKWVKTCYRIAAAIIRTEVVGVHGDTIFVQPANCNDWDRIQSVSDKIEKSLARKVRPAVKLPDDPEDDWSNSWLQKVWYRVLSDKCMPHRCWEVMSHGTPSDLVQPVVAEKHRILVTLRRPFPKEKRLEWCELVAKLLGEFSPVPVTVEFRLVPYPVPFKEPCDSDAAGTAGC